MRKALMNMSWMNVSWVNAIQVAFWTLLSWAVVMPGGAFLYDEAFFYHQAFRVFHEGYLPVVGPFISGTYEPTGFTPGGGFFLAISPAFLLGSSPHWGTAWLILFSSLSILFLDRTLKRTGQPAALRVFVVTFLTWSVWHAYLVDRIWNVDLYWGLTLLILSVGLRMIAVEGARLPVALPVAFGVLAAFAVQTHMGGGLSVLVCAGLVLKFGRRHLNLRNVALVAAGGLALYVPYLVSEIGNGFVNTHAMGKAASVRGWNIGVVLQGLKKGFLAYPTHFRDLRFAPFEGLSDSIRFFASLPAIAVFWIGLRQKKHPFRYLVIAALVGTPIYFLVIRRSYYDHYVASLIPFFLLGQALGTWKLYQDGGRRRQLAIAHAVTFAMAAAALWIGDYTPGHVGIRVSDRIRQAEALRNAPPMKVASGNYPEAFVLWTIAKDTLGFDPRFSIEGTGKTCSVRLGEPQGSNETMGIKGIKGIEGIEGIKDEWIFPGSYFACEDASP